MLAWMIYDGRCGRFNLPLIAIERILFSIRYPKLQKAAHHKARFERRGITNAILPDIYSY